MYIDLITIQIFNYDTPISFDNKPQNVIALDFDQDEHYVLTSKPVIRATLALFEPKQCNFGKAPRFFTA